MQRPEFFVFFGLIATGKSTVAQAWADQRGLTYYNSDVVRKELAGLAPSASRQEAVGQGIYSSDFSRKTYTALLERAESDLTAGRGVVLDASYQGKEERQRVRDLAARLGVNLCFVLCSCPELEMKRRMEQRALDPNAVSDGRWEIYLKQKERFEVPDELSGAEFIELSTDLPVNDLLHNLLSMVEEKL
ncbi:MAG: AAA family ATPase [Desulfobulbaceae bacterium]|nr:AAA family ATPase [Desulfobulbaceae bacterium]HIJ79035.1 AAA family ATPase [Deltaproteobacteria bacterium]